MTRYWTMVLGAMAVLFLGCSQFEPIEPTDTLSVPDTASIPDTVPVPDTAAVPDTVPVPDTTPVEDTTPVADTAPAEDTTPIEDTGPVEDTTPVADATPVEDTAPVADATPVEDTASIADTAPVADASGPDCDEGVIAFTADNPSMFEFYELCIPKGDDALVAQLQAIDSTLYCGVNGIFAQCSKNGLNGCHGDLAFEPGSKVITADKWAELCALSLMDGVSIIAGGHWL